jgi:hypothetical protein
MLTYDEKALLLKRLPSFELSYETILHKKVCGDVFMLIPKGKKAILWITYWKGQNICVVMPLNQSGHISIQETELQQLCFSNEMAYGTLVYGTLFSVNNMKHFTCENILYYKGNNIENYTFNQQMNVFSTIFKNKEITQSVYTKKFIVVGMPVMCNNYEDALKIKLTLPYSVYAFNIYSLNSYSLNSYSLNTYIGSLVIKNELCKNELGKQEVYKNELGKQEVGKQEVYKREVGKREVFFKVKATVDADIYNLYCANTETLYGVAMIQSYKTSVMMNSLFRTIKENSNLDLLEESDSEEEFENIDDCKFVDINKTLIMKCSYMPKFKKWQPISVTNDNVKIVTYKDAQYLEK